MPFVRNTSFWDHVLTPMVRSITTTDYVAAETFTAGSPIPCDVRFLNANERAVLSREQHGATLHVECDLDAALVEGDRCVWDHDPEWTYEVAGANRTSQVAELLLRRVNG